MSPGQSDVGEPLAVAFLPLHKRAFGTATGVAAALAIFLITAIHLLIVPRPGFPLAMLAQYFSGYTVSWPGALIGAAWAGFMGFVLGWFVAFCRNFLLAVMFLVVRSRAELSQTKDFLDHI